MSPCQEARAERRTKTIFAAAAAALFLSTFAGPVHAAGGVSVELNRMEPKDQSCRVSFVVANPGDKAIDSLKLDLVFFDKEGVISRRLAVEAGPVRASKTSVKLFEAADTPCDGVSRILLNEVTACGGAEDCLGQVSLTSRVKGVEFTK